MGGAMDDSDDTPPTLPYAPHDASRKRRDVVVVAVLILVMVFVVIVILLAGLMLIFQVGEV
jgi:hypothetical protein